MLALAIVALSLAGAALVLLALAVLRVHRRLDLLTAAVAADHATEALLIDDLAGVHKDRDKRDEIQGIINRAHIASQAEILFRLMAHSVTLRKVLTLQSNVSRDLAGTLRRGSTAAEGYLSDLAETDAPVPQPLPEYDDDDLPVDRD